METPYWQIASETTFRIGREIARGGMGVVYDAHQLGAEGFEKRVALKVILQELTDDSEFVSMFIDEAKLVADLVHENIVQIYQLGQSRGLYFMSIEFIDGVTLEEFLLRHETLGRRVPVEISAFIIARVCRALEYAHTKHDHEGRLLNIVHRDVSPCNVMLTYGGVAKLTDFGIAKARSLTQDFEGELLLGKVRYMSPEQAKFQVTDHRSDIFTAGILLYELLSQTAMFEGEDTIVLLDKVIEAHARPIRDLKPDVPDELTRIVERALERKPKDRYQTAGSMGFDLENFMYRDRFGPTNLSLHRYMRSLFPDRVKALIDPSVPDPYFERLGLEIGE